MSVEALERRTLLSAGPTATISALDVTVAGGKTETITVTYTDPVAIARTSVGKSDVTVTGPGGTALKFKSVVAYPLNSQAQIVATYVFAGPHKHWSAADDGFYTVSVRPNVVYDTAGVPVPPTSATFAVAIAGDQPTPAPTPAPTPSPAPTPDPTPAPTPAPTPPPVTGPADLTAPTAGFVPSATVTAYGATSETIQVNYADNAAINPASIGAQNLTVTSPGGQSLVVTGATPSTDTPAAAISVTYTISAPAGGWTSNSNGTYSVSVKTAVPDAVTDTSGNAVVAASGSFTVAVAPPPTAAIVPPAAVTAYGTASEAVQVNYAGSAGINLSTLGTGNLTVTGPGGQALAVTGAAVGTGSDGASVGVTYTVSGPARGWTSASNGTYSVSVNTSGAGAVADANGNSVGPASATFTVNVPPPPKATISPPQNIIQINSAPEMVVVTYSDAAGVNANSISTDDLSVTGPTGQPLTVTGVSVTPPGDAATITATYTVAVPGGPGALWSPADDGGYTVTLRPNQVTNTGGAPAASASSQFGVNIPLPPTTVDTSFFGGGSVSSGFVAEGAAVQADGRIVLAGRVGDVSAGTSQSVLERLNTDGTLDTTFGAGGRVTSASGGNDADYAVTLEAGGAIVTAGTHAGKFAVERYLPNGTPDASFGAGGQAVTALGGSSDAAYAVAVAPNGSIVAGGSSNGGFAFVRYLSDGTPDKFFGQLGISLFALGAGSSTSNVVGGLTVQPDGSIIAAGASGDKVALIRLTANGAGDGAFGNSGAMLVSGLTTPQNPGTPAGTPDHVTGVAVQSDGKILVANTSSAGHFAVARINPNGSVDSTFGASGIATASFGGNDAADAVIVQSSGEILAVGTTDAGGLPQIAVAAFGRNGALDPTFGSGGEFTVPAGITAPAGALAAQAIHVGDLFLHAFGAVAPSGKLVVGSTDESASGNTSSGLRRLNVPGAGLIGSFGTTARKNHKLSFQNNSGVAVTLEMKGAGLGQAYFNGTTIDLILTGTGPTTSVTVKGKGGNGQIGILNVQADGGLKAFTAKTATLSGTFSAKGDVGQVTLLGLTGTLAAAGSIGSVSVGVTGLSNARILAGADLGSDGQLGGAGTAADAFAGAAIAKLKVAGPVTASLVEAGLSPTNEAALAGGGTIVGGAASRIGSISVRGVVDTATRFIAGAFGSVGLPKKIKDLSGDQRFEVL